MNYHERYFIEERFHIETGYFAPGVDIPAAYHSANSTKQEVRSAAWDVWHKMRGEDLLLSFRAAEKYINANMQHEEEP